MLHRSQVTLFRWRDTLAVVLLHQQSAGLQGWARVCPARARVAALSASLSSRWTVEWESLPHCCNPTACFHINRHKFGLFHSWHRSGFTLITILWIYVSWRLSFLLHYTKSDYFLGHVQIHRSRANKKKKPSLSLISVKREFDMEEIPDYLRSSVQFGFIYMVQILNNSYFKVIYIVKILQYYREDVDRWSFLSISWQQWGGKTTRWEKRQKKGA